MNAATKAGRLTTHVLDTMSGRPAAGMQVELYRIEGGEREALASVRTNADGRCDGPVLAGEDFRPGIYELLFHVGSYLRAQGVTLPEPAFLDVVPIRFGLASTYRGS
jgi:5-hydroxyisourate hydrolase